MRLPAHDKYAPYAGLAFAAYVAQFVGMVGCDGEIDYVARLDHVVAARNDGVVATFDGRYVEIVAERRQITQLHSHDAGVVAQLHAHEYQPAAPEFEPVAYPCAVERGYDLLCGQIFRIDERVHSYA